MMKRFVIQINKRIEVVQLYNPQKHSFSELTFEAYFSTRIQVVHFVFVTTNNGMLSPDNFVQDATSTQRYNRLAYAYNNPLKYTDPSGEWFGADDAIVAGAGFVIGVGTAGGGEFRLGGGVAVGHGDVALGIYSTYYGAANGSSQRVGGASLAIGDFKMRYENDWFFGMPTGDNGDRYRTAAAQISYGDFSLGVNLYTGAPQERNGQRLTDQGWVNKGDLNCSMCYEESSSPRLGAIYAGYQNYRVGYNSEMLRYNIQNKLVHDKINSPYFNYVGYNTSNFYYRQQTNFRYSLW